MVVIAHRRPLAQFGVKDHGIGVHPGSFVIVSAHLVGVAVGIKGDHHALLDAADARPARRMMVGGIRNCDFQIVLAVDVTTAGMAKLTPRR